MTYSRTNVTARAVRMLVVLAAFLSSVAVARPPKKYEVTARVAIEEMNSTGTIQLARRELPWAGETITERVPLVVPADAPEGITPGLRMATTRLAAREELRSRVLAKAGALPAADPIPGETGSSTVAMFAERNAAVASALNALTGGGLIERHLHTEGGLADVLEGRAELAALGEAVLAAGGGRRIDPKMLERRAAEQALDDARMKLLTAISKHNTPSGKTIAEFAKDSPQSNSLVIRLVRNAQVVRSSPEDGPRTRDWVVTLALAREDIDAIAPKVKKKKSSGNTLPGTRSK
jgi:hypothetical protein